MMRALPLALVSFGCSEYEFNKSTDGRSPTDDESDTGSDDPSDEPDEGAAGVTGVICDTSGDGAVVGAYVYVPIDSDGDGTEDFRIESTTDSDGRFVLSGVPLGEHTVYVEKGSFTTTFQVVLDDEDELVELAYEECLDPESVNIAVVTGMYDDISAILDRLGLPYTKYNGIWGTQYLDDLLKQPDTMATYDIIFFNCGMSEDWERTDKNEVGTNVKSYVEDGGSIYASDWAYYLFEAAFDGAIDFYGEDTDTQAAKVGQSTTITADVNDSNLQSILGSSTARLNYNLDVWVVPEEAKEEVDVLLTGDAPLYYGGRVVDAPLAVRMNRGGKALYTSFHNEAQTTVDMDAILEEIVLSL